MNRLAQIKLIEELAANAWNAHTNQFVAGWRLRWNDGITQRANSVLALACEGDLSLNQRIMFAEEFYQRHHAPPCFQISPAVQPSNLDETLATLGYAACSETTVKIAPVIAVLARTNAPHSVTVSEELTEVWWQAYVTAVNQEAHILEVRRGILQRAPRTGYALAKIDGQPAAIGLGVVERGWLGLFSIDTFEAFRQRGAATAVLQTLMQWGERYGARHTYLQVMNNNTPALNLYAKLGFEKLYQYHYRKKNETQ